MTRALISGLTGMVGSHLADYLLANTDWEIYGMLRWRSPLDNIEHLLGHINNGYRIHLVYADLSEEAGLRNAVKAAAPDLGMLRWRSPLDNIEHLLGHINNGYRIHLVYADLSEEAGLRNAVKAAAP